ncbi:MAG: hypothetical protein HYS57_01995 [Parcubacteria group bacterium]|nr:hypothetical protein [Parcubacteria group bacterium]
MRLAIAILVLAIFATPTFAQEESESKLFPVTAEMCSFAWLWSQRITTPAGSLHAGTVDWSDNIFEVDFIYGSAVERQTGRNRASWKYTYIFLNCSEAPLIFFTSPGLPSGTLTPLEDIYGRVTSIVRLNPMQGLKIFFLDDRPAVVLRGPYGWYRTLWILSPFDTSRVIGLGINIHEPDPTLPRD